MNPVPEAPDTLGRDASGARGLLERENERLRWAVAQEPRRTGNQKKSDNRSPSPERR
jgi:hypothetical protein